MSVFLAVALFISSASIGHASVRDGDGAPVCEPIDFSRAPLEGADVAGKRAFNLNTGDPRAVRVVYFVPADSLFRPAVEDSIRRAIRRIRTFYAEQMEAHGYGNRTFDVETGDDGAPRIHRVTGQHAEDRYAGDQRHSRVFSEIRQNFDTGANVYVAVIDYIRSPTARGGRRGKIGGEASVGGNFKWETVAHELGHTFGLEHDFRDGDYIMSYSNRQNRISACAAEFLSVNPYFNAGRSIDQAQPPSIELLSPRRYPAGSKSVLLQLRVEDPQGLHQVTLFATTSTIRPGFPRGYYEVTACRGLPNGTHAVVEFEYDGDIPSSSGSALPDTVAHPLHVKAVDKDGNVGRLSLDLVEISAHHVAALEGHRDRVESLAFSPDGSILASGSSDDAARLWDVAGREQLATLRQAGRIKSVSISPDGKTLASSSDDHTVKLWDLIERELISVLRGHKSPVNGVAFSPDGNLLASASDDHSVRLWDVAEREHTATLEGHASPVNGVAFSPDGNLLASASNDHSVRLWDVAEREQTAMLEGHASPVNGVAFSPDGNLLASASDDHSVRLWDIAKREHAATLEGHASPVNGVAFSPDGNLLASASDDRTVRLRDVAKREQLAILPHTDAFASVVFSPDGTILAAGSVTVELWETSGWRLPRAASLTTVSGDNQKGAAGDALANPLVVEVRDQYDQPLAGAQVTFTVIGGDGSVGSGFTTVTATAGPDGRAQIVLTLGPNPGKNTVEASIVGFEVQTFNAVGVGTPPVPGADRNYPTQHLPKNAIVRLGKGAIGRTDRAIGFSPDGKRFAVSSGVGVWLYSVDDLERVALLPSGIVQSLAFSSDGATIAAGGSWREHAEVRLWDAATGTNTATVDFESWGTIYLSLSPDGQTFAYPAGEGVIHRLDAATGRSAPPLEGDWSVGPSMSFSPDSTTIAVAHEDGTITLWDLAVPANSLTLEGHRREVVSVAFSPDGRALASASDDGTVKLWDAASGAVTATVRGDKCRAACVAFSPDGAKLASGWTDRTVTLWDIAGERTIATFSRHRDWLSAVVFSPDGKTLASASEDGEVYLWDLATGNATAVPGHTESVWGMAFSPDGSTLASRAGTARGKVNLWDVATGLKTVTLGGHEGPLRTVSYSPDGATLATGSHDRTVRLWNLDRNSTFATLRHSNEVSSSSFSPDGTTLGTGDSKGNVILWDVNTQRQINAFNVLGERVTTLVFSPDGATLAAGTYGGEVRLWDAATGTAIRDLEGHSQSVLSMTFSRDGTTLATGSFHDSVKVWNLATGTAGAALKGKWMDTVTFSPDGTIFATGTQERLARLYDMSTGDVIARIEGHHHYVTSVLFTPDGKTLATGSQDGTILLWDLQRLLSRPQLLRPVSGIQQKAPAGTGLAQPFVVSVRDQNGEPYAGATVTFVVIAGGGTLSATTDTTDANGQAGTTLTLGRQPGANIVVATVADLDPVTFRAVAQANPDFDGDGTVGFGDFVLFAGKFGLSRDDDGFEARYDLDGNGTIGFGDFLIFGNAFGRT